VDGSVGGIWLPPLAVNNGCRTPPSLRTAPDVTVIIEFTVSVAIHDMKAALFQRDFVKCPPVIIWESAGQNRQESSLLVKLERYRCTNARGAGSLLSHES